MPEEKKDQKPVVIELEPEEIAAFNGYNQGIMVAENMYRAYLQGILNGRKLKGMWQVSRDGRQLINVQMDKPHLEVVK